MSNDLKQLVKDIQYNTGKTLAEIAAVLEYSSAYFTDQVNKGKNGKLKELLLKKFPNKTEENVRRGTQEPTPETKNPPTADDRYIRLMEETIKELRKDKEFYQTMASTSFILPKSAVIL